VAVCFVTAEAQKQRVRETGTTAVVIDERLSLLRTRPSLFADAVQRMRRGRRVQILGVTESDGVKFYRIASSGRSGWLQSEAVFGRFRPGDEERLARLVQASDGFDQVELAVEFLRLYPSSRLRPPMLLLLGDLLEQAAVKLSRDAASRLDRRQMAVSGAPVHSYYLNFNMLDRYRRLGVRFLFDPSTRTFHYNGACWREIVRKYPAAVESAEAQKRLESLRTKMSG
jgi:hypothetical protein